MAKLAKLAEAKNVTVRKLVADAINEHGSIFRAALALGVTPNSLQFWLKRNGYTVKTSARLVPVNHHPEIEPIHDR